MAPLYYESYWISGYVNDAFKRSYFRMLRSRFVSHHMPVMLSFLPVQRCENLEGGPPCNSMPLVWLGRLMRCKSSYYLVWHCVNKLTLLFCLGGSRQILKVHKVKCVPGETPLLCALIYLKSPAPCCHWLSIV